jgi:hypothetical protein
MSNLYIGVEKISRFGSPEVKSADMERNIEGIVLQVHKKEGSCRLDLVISISLVYLIGWCMSLGLN